MLVQKDPDSPSSDDEALDIVLLNKMGLADEIPCEANHYRQSALHRFEMLMQLYVKEMRRDRELEMIKRRGRGAYCECLFHRTGDFVAAYQRAMQTMRENGEII